MAVDVEFCSCDELLEPGNERVQVIFVLQCLKFAVGIVFLVCVSEHVCEVSQEGGLVDFVSFWYIGSDVVLK